MWMGTPSPHSTSRPHAPSSLTDPHLRHAVPQNFTHIYATHINVHHAHKRLPTTLTVYGAVQDRILSYVFKILFEAILTNMKIFFENTRSKTLLTQKISTISTAFLTYFHLLLGFCSQ